MATPSSDERPISMERLGITNTGAIYANLPAHRLVEESLQRGEGRMAPGGALVVSTGVHTGRSPRDKFVVRDEHSESLVRWGSVNHPMTPEQFERLHLRMLAYLQGRTLFVIDAAAGADDRYRVPVRVITEQAWPALFSQIMFRTSRVDDDHDSDRAFTVIQAPGFTANPAIDGTRSDVFIALSFSERLVLIGGTRYAGEIKKSIFTVANYLFPPQGALSMHCSANEGPDGDVALFFGLSGTGKTTLSADPQRRLIGDDEHVWGDAGIFNIEGGCYAKVINLSPHAEPEIYATTRTFGTLLENVVIDEATEELDLDDDTITETTRAAYPIEMIPNARLDGQGGHPRNLIMLTADAFGVLPPVAKLTADQAMYHFLSGYTAKVAGTEKGVTEPKATFSACFGSPFLPLRPSVYADLLGERINAHEADVWLVNTGWTGGPHGVGHRMPIQATRAIVRAILSGELAGAATITDPIFGLHVPVECDGVEGRLLDPRSTWTDPAAYDEQARRLAAMFVKNFEQYADDVRPEIRAAGPIQTASIGDESLAFLEE
ncbi:MAG: phosphoenolpyruvate carboxykinase (ATP) [Thermomicrobiales bacterium]|nr:phosphoenolpyruvate carboxykinase (ATP) [Thermomicrobiales bacterium]